MAEREQPEDPTAPVSPEQVYDWGMMAAKTYMRVSGSSRFADSEDMIADALEAAWKAQSTYDPALGTRFGYTYNRARYAVIDGLRARGHYTREQVRQGAHQEPEALPAQLRPPVSLEAIQQGMNEAAAGAKAGFVIDFPDPHAEDPTRDFENQSTIAKLLPLLREPDAEVLRRYYLEGDLLHEIAADRGVTESRVSQIKTGALLKLRAALSAEDLDALVA